MWGQVTGAEAELRLPRMAGFCQLANGNGSLARAEDCLASVMDAEETKTEILLLSGFSTRLETILLALLRDQKMLKDKLEVDKAAVMSAIDRVGLDLAAEKQVVLSSQIFLANI